MFRTATVLNAARKVVARNFSSYQNAQQAATKSFLVAGSIATVGVVAYANYSPISMCAPNYVALRKEIIEMCEKEDERRDDGTSIYGTLVRLAWHASGKLFENNLYCICMTEGKVPISLHRQCVVHIF